MFKSVCSCCVCSCERREKEFFLFIEMYEFFKYKNSFGVATMFFVSREAL